MFVQSGPRGSADHAPTARRESPSDFSPLRGGAVRLSMPDGEVVEFEWGRYWQFGTAAYWITQYWRRFGDRPLLALAIGRSLLEETAACILGGHGVPAEVGLAAFRAVRDAGLLDGSVRGASEFGA